MNGESAGWIALICVGVWLGACIAIGASGLLAAVQDIWNAVEGPCSEDE